jgi:hypothetical protein
VAFVRCLSIAVWAIALHIGAVQAADVLRVRALADCPQATDDAACIEMRMHWDAARTDRPRMVAKDKAVRVIAVRGRLGEGGVRAYELEVASHDPADARDLGLVAYLGRSREWRPIIVTDRGALAIETRGVLVGRSQGVTVINEKTRKIMASYLSGLSGGTYVVRGPDDLIVLSKSGACVSPPPSVPGALARASGCDAKLAAREAPRFSERVAGDVKPVSDGQLGLVRSLLPQTRDLSDAELRSQVGRIGLDHLIVTPWARVKSAKDR